jgi:hypothetical protein
MAQKTIRGLLNHRISFLELETRCGEFGQLRKKAINRNAETMTRVKNWTLELASYPGTARRLVSFEDLKHAGHQMENCLAESGWEEHYRQAMRDKEKDFIVIEAPEGYDALLSICSNGMLEQVAGPRNSRPLWCREAIIEVLMHRGIQAGECQQALQVGICDELLQGRSRGENLEFAIDGWSVEIGSGFAAGMRGEETWLLRARGYFDWDSTALVIAADDERTSFAREIDFRCWFRAACVEDEQFRQACRRAFSGVPAMCLDFGILRAPPRLAALEKMRR